MNTPSLDQFNEAVKRADRRIAKLDPQPPLSHVDYLRVMMIAFFNEGYEAANGQSAK